MNALVIVVCDTLLDEVAFARGRVFNFSHREDGAGGEGQKLDAGAEVGALWCVSRAALLAYIQSMRDC